MIKNEEDIKLKYYITFKHLPIVELKDLDADLYEKVLEEKSVQEFEIEILQKGDFCEILSFPISIDRLIQNLELLKNTGANYVSIGDSDDEFALTGYRFQGVEVKPSTKEDIEKHLLEMGL